MAGSSDDSDEFEPTEADDDAGSSDDSAASGSDDGSGSDSGGSSDSDGNGSDFGRSAEPAPHKRRASGGRARRPAKAARVEYNGGGSSGSDDGSKGDDNGDSDSAPRPRPRLTFTGDGRAVAVTVTPKLAFTDDGRSMVLPGDVPSDDSQRDESTGSLPEAARPGQPPATDSLTSLAKSGNRRSRPARGAGAGAGVLGGADDGAASVSSDDGDGDDSQDGRLGGSGAPSLSSVPFVAVLQSAYRAGTNGMQRLPPSRR